MCDVLQCVMHVGVPRCASGFRLAKLTWCGGTTLSCEGGRRAAGGPDNVLPLACAFWSPCEVFTISGAMVFCQSTAECFSRLPDRALPVLRGYLFESALSALVPMGRADSVETLAPVVSRRSEGVPLRSCSPVLALPAGMLASRLAFLSPVKFVGIVVPLRMLCATARTLFSPCRMFDLPHVLLAPVGPAPCSSFVALTEVLPAAAAVVPELGVSPLRGLSVHLWLSLPSSVGPKSGPVGG